MLRALAMRSDVVVGPHRGEGGARPAQLVDERLPLLAPPDPSRLEPERLDGHARVLLPVLDPGPGVGVAEEQAQDVAVTGRERAVVGEDGRGSAVPRDDVPRRRLDKGGAGTERVEDPLEAVRDGPVRQVADLGWAAVGEQEEVLALGRRQHERAGDAVENLGGGRAAAPLLEPRVPRRADVGSEGNLLAAKAGRAPTYRVEPEGYWVEPGAAVLQKRSQRRLGRRHNGVDRVER